MSDDALGSNDSWMSEYRKEMARIKKLQRIALEKELGVSADAIDADLMELHPKEPSQAEVVERFPADCPLGKLTNLDLQAALDAVEIRIGELAAKSLRDGSLANGADVCEERQRLRNARDAFADTIDILVKIATARTAEAQRASE